MFFCLLAGLGPQLTVRNYDPDVVRQLNDAFFAGYEAPTITGSDITRLPLWRVQWNAMPGTREVYNVRVAHYTNMFEMLDRCPRPCYFGHIHLPEGSKNLKNDEFALRNGTKAALTGTLMELVMVHRNKDGTLIAVSQGVGRFKVRQVVEDQLHTVVNAELLEQYAYEKKDIEWEYGALKVPELAPCSLVGESAQASDLEMQCWALVVRASHLLLECQIKRGTRPADATLVPLPTPLLELQPPNVADAVLAGAECLGSVTASGVPPYERAARFSFIALTAVAGNFLDAARDFRDLLDIATPSLLDKAMTRQRLLEAPSTDARLALVIAILEQHVATLTAYLLL